MPKCIAGPNLIIDTILSKYNHHLPAYRQAKIMQSNNINIMDKTIANWIVLAGKALMPIYDSMWSALKNRYIQVDETPVKVLETNKQGYVWAYLVPNAGKSIVIFDFSLTRSGSAARERLKTFKGLLQTDGYAGYLRIQETR